MAQYPTFSVGQRITAAALQDIVPQFVTKPATTSIVSSTTFALDADLSVPVVANATYFVEMWLKVAAGATGDIKTTWDVPAGSTGNRSVSGPSSGVVIYGAAGTTTSQSDADNSLAKFGIHGFGTSITYNGIRDGGNAFNIVESSNIAIGATAGNVTLMWAQNVSNATATSVAGGSLIRCTRIA